MKIEDYLHLYIGQKMLYTGKGFPFRGTSTEEILTIDNFELLSFSTKRKLMLRPLSDMTEEEAIEFIHRKHRSILCNIDRTDVTKVSFGSTKNIINFSYFRQRGAGAEAGSKTYYVNQSDPEQFVFLLSLGFDLFGLIESGLAIGTTIKQENESFNK